MRDLFFYGTLCHEPLLAVVLGRAATNIDVIPATLPCYTVYWAAGQAYPMVQAERGGCAQGVLVRGLTDRDMDRLVFYEGGFGYELRPVALALGDGARAEAEMFFPPDRGSDLPAPGAPWRLEDWVEQWGPMSLRAAVEVMSYFGRMTPAEIAPRFPSIRRRAWSWLAAARRARDPERSVERDVELLDHRQAHLNFFGMEEAKLRFRRHDGGMSEPVERSAVMVGEAAVVLPYDPVRDSVLLVEQFRAPVLLAGDPAPWVWEPVAGLVDPGESPEQTARREAEEEAGLTLKRLEPAGRVYSSTGSSGEFLHLFIGIADLAAERGVGGGVDSEGEDIVAREVSFDALMRGVDEQTFRDMPLVTTALWLARHRDRLRETA